MAPIADVPGASGRTYRETTERKELVRWVLSWMPDVKVLAPKSLRDRIAEKLQAGLREHESGGDI